MGIFALYVSIDTMNSKFPITQQLVMISFRKFYGGYNIQFVMPTGKLQEQLLFVT
jgi:hypothetical protein